MAAGGEEATDAPAVRVVFPAAENWEGLEATVEKYGSEARWRYLENFESLHRGNVNRSYVQFENNESGETPKP